MTIQHHIACLYRLQESLHKHIREATAGAGYILSLEFDREPVAAKILSRGSSGVATSKWIKNEVVWFSEKLNEEFR